MNNKTKRGILIFTTLLLISLSVVVFWRASGWAQTSALKPDRLRQARPVVLKDGQSEYPLGLHMELLEDPGGKLTIDQVSSPAYDAQFIPSQSESPGYGFTNSAYWVRVKLDNEARKTNEWVLEQDFANMQYVDLFTRLPDSKNFIAKQTGSFRPLSTRDIPYPRILFELILPTQTQQTYYLRFQSGSSMTLPHTLWAKNAFWIHAQREQLQKWLFFGAILALLVYHLFLLYFLRETIYLYFVLLLASIFVTIFTYDGYMGVYLFPGLYTIPKFIPISFSLLVSALVLFSDAFLDLKNSLPKFRPVRTGLLASCGAMILLSLFIRYDIFIRLVTLWAILSMLVLGAAGIAVWKRGFHPAGFLMLAWLGMFASIILVLLVRLGIVPSSYFSENIFYVGLLWMSLCWAIALADRINRLKVETENANQGLRMSERRLSQILEGMPLGVVLYGKDHKPRYINQRTVELLSNPAHGLQPDLSAGRTLAKAIQDFSLKPAGSALDYPLESFPVFSALQGQPASADDIEMDHGDKRVPLEMWANPVRDEAGNVESAVVAFQDISRRKQAEAELGEYRKQLESLVVKGTAELDSSNKELRLRLEWMSAIVLVTEAMARSSDSSQIYEKIVEIINRLLAIQDTFIAELDESRDHLKILAHSCQRENHPELIGSFTTIPANILDHPIQEQGKLIFLSGDQLSSMSGLLRTHLQAEKTQGIVLTPLLLHEQVFGFLGLELLEEGRTITSEESSLLRIFSLDIAHLIEDSRLFEQSKALITAEERNRLARDLHDSVTQLLYSASLIAELLPQRFQRDPEAAIASAVELRRLTHGALAEMRTMLLELRPAGITTIPLGVLLTQLIEAVSSRSELAIQLTIDNVPLLPAEVQTAFYRIAQEALNNVVKHAQECKVILSLSTTPPFGLHRFEHWDGEIRMVIRDDGTGFSPEDQGLEHLGLGIMRERAAAIGAIFALESHPGQGTQVTLTWHT